MSLLLETKYLLPSLILEVLLRLQILIKPNYIKDQECQNFGDPRAEVEAKLTNFIALV